MTAAANVAYRFDGFRVDPARRLLFGADGQPIPLKPKVFDTLLYLIERRGELVDKQALLDAVWPHVAVEENNLNKAISTLRQVLGETRAEHRFIVTEPGRGYRFVARVDAVPALMTQPPAAQTEVAIPPQADGTSAPTSRHTPSSAPRNSQSKRPQLLRASAVIAAACALAAVGVYWLASERTESADVGAPPPNSVAVLPFENLSPDPVHAFFAVSMQDEIVSQLTKISGLRVFPVRQSAGAQASVPDVATTLGGNVYYSAGRVRVNTHLSRAANDEILWSKSYEKGLSDIFEIQSEIALDVAQGLRLELSATERQRVERVPTTDPRARDLYLVARARKPLSPEVLLAIADVEQALALDAEFKEAWVLDAQVRVYAQFVDPERADEHRRRAEQAARRAIGLDPELGQAHAALGWVLLTKRDWANAEASFRSAVNLNVPTAELGPYAFLQLSAGKFNAFAHDIYEQARAANPQNELQHRMLAFLHEGRGEWARANAIYESALHLFQSDGRATLNIVNQEMHWLVGRDELTQARAIRIDDALNAAMLENLDTPDQALAVLRREHAAGGNPVRRRDIGLWAAHFGDPVLALDAMRAAIDEQGSQIIYVWLPQAAAMRRLPEFEAYMREIGMVAYWQEYGWPTLCRPLAAQDFECD